MFDIEATAVRFSFRYYFITLTRLIGEPRRYFSEISHEPGVSRPLGFLISSSLIFTGGTLLKGLETQPVVAALILIVNALGMVLISSALGYLVVILTFGRVQTFGRFFSIYALASGVTLLAAWVPNFIWLTEPWKWWLIAIGLVHGCGFNWKQSLMVIAISAGLITIIFWLLTLKMSY